jgi:dCTP deaminase
MVLNDLEIRERIAFNDLVAIPNMTYASNPEIFEASIQPGSYDLTLGDSFKKIMKRDCIYPNKAYVELNEPLEYVDLPYENEHYKGIIIHPGEFILASSQEIVKLPDDLSAIVTGRSSIGRAGIDVVLGNWIDAGYIGTVTLQLHNCGPNPVRLTKGLRIAQLVFLKMTASAEKPYHGKYMHSMGAAESKIYEDFKETSVIEHV